MLNLEEFYKGFFLKEKEKTPEERQELINNLSVALSLLISSFEDLDSLEKNNIQTEIISIQRMFKNLIKLNNLSPLLEEVLEEQKIIFNKTMEDYGYTYTV